MFDLFLDTLIIMFVVIDPLGIAPIFAALTHGETMAVKRRTASARPARPRVGVLRSLTAST